MSAAKIKPIVRERITLSLNESDSYLLLVSELEESEAPMALAFYVLAAEYQGGSSWLVPSKADPETKYETDIDRNWCSCVFYVHNFSCAHLRAMRLRSKLQFSQNSSLTSK